MLIHDDGTDDAFIIRDTSISIEPAHGVPVFPNSPEACLMRAVLEDAVAIVFQYHNEDDSHPRRCLREAEEWINSTDEHWPYSFVNICGALGIDPDYFRERLWETVRLSKGKRYALRRNFERCKE